MEDKKKKIKETTELLETYKREIEEALGGAPDLDARLTMNGKMKLLELDYEVDDWEEVKSKAIESLEKQSKSTHLGVCGNWYYCMYGREVQDEVD